MNRAEAPNADPAAIPGLEIVAAEAATMSSPVVVKDSGTIAAVAGSVFTLEEWESNGCSSRSSGSERHEMRRGSLDAVLGNVPGGFR